MKQNYWRTVSSKEDNNKIIKPELRPNIMSETRYDSMNETRCSVIETICEARYFIIEITNEADVLCMTLSGRQCAEFMKQ